jgi:hypothetical protein
MKKLLFGAVVALLAVVVAGRVGARADKPKSIEEIMEMAHKGSDDPLLPKLLEGKGTAKDAKELLALYVDLSKNDPPKGSKEAWKKRTDAIVAAAKKVAANHEDKEALAGLKKVVVCAECHKEHQP